MASNSWQVLPALLFWLQPVSSRPNSWLLRLLPESSLMEEGSCDAARLPGAYTRPLFGST